jgi:hypothetical protein
MEQLILEKLKQVVSHFYLVKSAFDFIKFISPRGKKIRHCKQSKRFNSSRKPFDWLRLVTQTIMVLKLILEITHHS